MTAPYRIELTRDALRSLVKLDKPIRRRIQGAIDIVIDLGHRREFYRGL